jgi:hypothetical protein
MKVPQESNTPSGDNCDDNDNGDGDNDDGYDDDDDDYDESISRT